MPTEIAEGGQATVDAMQRMRDTPLPEEERDVVIGVPELNQMRLQAEVRPAPLALCASQDSDADRVGSADMEFPCGATT